MKFKTVEFNLDFSSRSNGGECQTAITTLDIKVHKRLCAHLATKVTLNSLRILIGAYKVLDKQYREN